MGKEKIICDNCEKPIIKVFQIEGYSMCSKCFNAYNKFINKQIKKDFKDRLR